MDAVPSPPRVLQTARVGFERPSFSATPPVCAAPLRKVTAEWVAARPNAPNIGRKWTGCGVEIEAFGSPISAMVIVPILRTRSGFTAKKAGDQIGRAHV